MAVQKQQVRIVIPGLTNRTEKEYFTRVPVYRPNLNIQTFKKAVASGFTITDFIEPELFMVYDSTNIRRQILNQNDIRKDDTLFIVNAHEDIESQFKIGEYYWLYNEVVLVTNINRVQYTDGFYSQYEVYNISVARGQFGTIPKMYAGFEFENADFNFLESHKNDFNGLKVELYDMEDRLVALGVLSEVTYVGGAMVLECDDYYSTLEVKAPTHPFYGADFDAGYDDDDSEPVELLATNLIKSFFGFLNLPPSASPAEMFEFRKYNFFHKESDLSYYMDESELTELLRRNFIAGRSFLAKDTAITDLISIIEFTSGKFLVFSNERFRILPLFSLESTFAVNSSIEQKEVWRDLSNIKYTSTRIFSPEKITFSFANKDINIFSYSKVSIGSGAISFKVNSELTDETEARLLLEKAFDNYFRIMDYAICELRIQTPSAMNKDDYYVGQRFIIKDIDKFYTFENKEIKTFNVGIVIKNESNDVSILVTNRSFFDPITPCLPANAITSTPIGPDQIVVVSTGGAAILPYTLDVSNNFGHRPPYIDRPYLKVGDSMMLIARSKTNRFLIREYVVEILELNTAGVISIVMTGADFADMTTSNFETSLLTYPNIGDENEFQDNFCKLDGSSVWL